MAKKAVLIGINYPGTAGELKGCVNDVKRMYDCLINRYGFSWSDINVLIDTDDSYPQPTGVNIRKALSDLVEHARSGDVLFVHYSGHGTRLPAETGEEDDTGYDECICPCDMNLITDDDFRKLVDKVPEGCRITIVSDSCHSGGLIEKTKEQIGESCKPRGDNECHGNEGSRSGFGFRNSSSRSVESHKQRNNNEGHGFRNFIRRNVEDAFESRGIRLPHRHNRREEDEEENFAESSVIEMEDGSQVHVKGKSLPLPTLIEILKQQTGKDDIDVGKLRATLFDVFGEDASPKVKKFMKIIYNQLQKKNEDGGGGGFLGMVGSLAQEFMKQKLDEGKQELYAGSGTDNGILISGCQTDQTSADARPADREPHGALSNAILEILAESDGPVSNWELVTKAREKMQQGSFSQRPGLYCDDSHVAAPFVC